MAPGRQEAADAAAPDINRHRKGKIMSAVADRIVGILTKKFSMDDTITPASEFAEMGLDSLVLLELSVILQREYGVRLSEEDLMEAGNVDGVVSLLKIRKAA
jgi:acyl carrier protein